MCHVPACTTQALREELRFLRKDEMLQPELDHSDVEAQMCVQYLQCGHSVYMLSISIPLRVCSCQLSHPSTCMHCVMDLNIHTCNCISLSRSTLSMVEMDLNLSSNLVMFSRLLRMNALQILRRHVNERSEVEWRSSVAGVEHHTDIANLHA